MGEKEERCSLDPQTEVASWTKQKCSGKRDRRHATCIMSFGVADPHFRVYQDRHADRQRPRELTLHRLHRKKGAAK